jgi:hypothetical protein
MEKGSLVVKTLKAPTDEEKCKIFSIVEVVRTFEESNALQHRWGVDDLPQDSTGTLHNTFKRLLNVD